MPGKQGRMRTAAIAGIVFASAFGVATAARAVFGTPVKARVGGSSSADFKSGPELVLIYIGQSTCAWCNDPALPGQFAAIRDTVARIASARGARFIVEGVSVDRDAMLGVEHLQKLGRFDEIHSGGWWANEVAFRYIWTDFPGDPATPQLLVVERGIEIPTGDSTRSENTYRIVYSRVLVRKVGTVAIKRWLGNGAVVPRILENAGRAPIGADSATRVRLPTRKPGDQE